ncbi:hypothetical protein SKAU_G00248080 [Synaphobranchus kaupii]|uniref:Uncharacterized protein n=1 Tax=Synaphobranchus kaupii TaxID=118154 RepID=A0A9Q1F2A8_SYNKA|nr:hypothetical protein SKAU_G00248080 [Synaphobranchus kaupii]
MKVGSHREGETSVNERKICGGLQAASLRRSTVHTLPPSTLIPALPHCVGSFGGRSGSDRRRQHRTISVISGSGPFHLTPLQTVSTCHVLPRKSKQACGSRKPDKRETVPSPELKRPREELADEAALAAGLRQRVGVRSNATGRQQIPRNRWHQKPLIQTELHSHQT